MADTGNDRQPTVDDDRQRRPGDLHRDGGVPLPPDELHGTAEPRQRGPVVLGENAHQNGAHDTLRLPVVA